MSCDAAAQCRSSTRQAGTASAGARLTCPHDPMAHTRSPCFGLAPLPSVMISFWRPDCAEADEKKHRLAVWARFGRWASSTEAAAARWGATRGAWATKRGAAAARELHRARVLTMAGNRGCLDP